MPLSGIRQFFGKEGPEKCDGDQVGFGEWTAKVHFHPCSMPLCLWHRDVLIPIQGPYYRGFSGRFLDHPPMELIRYLCGICTDSPKSQRRTVWAAFAPEP
jgi:hypothetical protein